MFSVHIKLGLAKKKVFANIHVQGQTDFSFGQESFLVLGRSGGFLKIYFLLRSSCSFQLKKPQVSKGRECPLPICWQSLKMPGHRITW